MLSNRLTVAMVVLVLLTTIGVGALIQLNITKSVIPVELERLQLQADRRALELNSYVRGTRADALAAVHNPIVIDFINALAESGGTLEPTLRKKWCEDIARYFVCELEVKTAYLQFRLINGEDGHELVRVDRSGPDGAIRIVEDSELQDKCNRPYFIHAKTTSPNDAYVSPIELNEEHGKIEVPHVPVLRVAAPIYRKKIPLASGELPEGESPIGVVVINVDMAPAFELQRASQEIGSHRFIANGDGDYVFNTKDPDSVFASSLGRTDSWRNDFPALAPTDKPKSRLARMIEDSKGERFGAAIARWRLGGGPPVVLIQTAPYEQMVQSASTVIRSCLVGAIVAVVLALAAAVFMARSLTKPLAELTRATEAFAAEESFDLPSEARGEIGILSRAFLSMSDSVGRQTEALRSEIEVRKKTEQELAVRNEKVRMFAAVVESSIDSIITMTLDGVVTAWNPAATTIYGYAAEEALGKKFDILVPDERKDEYQDVIDLVRAGETVDEFETVRRHKCGLNVTVSIKASPLYSSDGEVIGVAKISHDITAFKRAEENFRLVIDSTPSGIIVVDATGRIRLVNPSAAKMFGYRRDELLGQQVEKLVPTQSQVRHASLRASYAAAPEARPMGTGSDLQGMRKDGSKLDVEIGLSPIQSGSGQQILCSIVDVTERRRAHEKLAEYASRLERSNNDLQEFAYVVSHDLKAPLRGIASVADWIAVDFGEVVDDDARENLELMKDRIRRLDRLIEGILNYSRAGQKEMQRVAIHTEKMVAEIIDAIQPPDHIKIKVVGSLPIVQYDEIQLQQVFQNLIVNAINHMDKPEGQVVVSSQVDKDGCHFSVADNGPGINDRHFERIFGLFQTLKPKDECKSTGAGLAIVKRIVERNGGQVSVSSVEGAGATFSFSVPLEFITAEQSSTEFATT